VSVALPSAAAAAERRAAARRRRLLHGVGRHALLIATSSIFLLPFVYVLLTGVMTDHQALSQALWPHPFRLSNFQRVFDAVPFFRYYLNTTMVAVLSTIGVVVSGVPVAYALSRMRWRGQGAAFVLVLSTMMLPVQVTIIPLYAIFANQLHIVGTLWPLIIPSFFGDAFSIFLLRQFFLTIPQELQDAARVDGAGEFTTMLRVIVPLAKPAIAAVAIFNFLYAWNDFFAPLLYVGNKPEWYTLSIGLSQFKHAHHADYNLMMAASVLVLAPTVLLFLAAQRVFVEGVTLTGVKG